MCDGSPDLRNSDILLHYGAEAQTRIAEFSEIVLKRLRDRDAEEAESRLTALLNRLKISAEKNTPGPFRISAKIRRLRNLRLCEEIDRISAALLRHRDRLLKDVEMLELLFQMNREQYNELTVCLERGREALERFRRDGILPENTRKAPAEIRGAGEAKEQRERFERKLHDLELTRAVSLQIAPQIRLLQNLDTALAEKIQSAVTHTVPLWKGQLILSAGAEHSRTAATLQTKLREVTDALLTGNAKALKQTALAATAEGERSTLSADTLKETGKILLETVDQIARLREEGRTLRTKTEGELHRMEKEIRLRLTGTHTD